jgi:hypothetical protein
MAIFLVSILKNIVIFAEWKLKFALNVVQKSH